MSEPINPHAIAHDDPEPGSTWFVSLAGAVVFTALVLALSVLYYGVQGDRVDAVVVREAPAEFTSLRHAQLAQTVEYGRYTLKDAQNRDVAHIRIPVSEAMKLIVAEGGFASGDAAAEGASR